MPDDQSIVWMVNGEKLLVQKAPEQLRQDLKGGPLVTCPIGSDETVLINPSHVTHVEGRSTDYVPMKTLG